MRILVVEDDHLLNNTLCYNLSAAGYTVDGAKTKAAATQFSLKQDYDLVVLDINLPDGSGFDQALSYECFFEKSVRITCPYLKTKRRRLLR